MTETSTVETPVRPAFRKGAEAIEEAAKNAGRSFQKDHYFSLEDQESCIIHFITDEPDWISIGQYNFVPTKPAPLGDDGKPVEKWPKMMSAVARCDPAFEGIFSDDYIAENIVNPKTKKLFRPTPRTWALAVLREEVKEDGRVVGYRDKVREVEIPHKDGDKETVEVVKEKAIVIVNMATQNFFAPLIGFASRYGTILDRDYYIKRKGDGTDTKYEIVPLDPGVLDLRDPEVAKRYEYHTSLEDVVMARASDEYYGRFFDPNWVEPESEKTEAAEEAPVGGAPAAQQVKPESEPDADKLAALKERIQGYSGPDDAAPSEPAPETDAAPAASPSGMRNFD